MGKIIEERHFPTAEGLVKSLSPFDDFWLSTGGARCWQFRGQTDDAWKLVPSSMRPSALYEYAVAITGKHGDTDHNSDLFPFLVKFTTPLNQCRKLLRLLSDVEVCAPTIFPSYDAVRLGMAEESYWDER